MTGKSTNVQSSAQAFYGPQFSRFGTRLAAEVRREAYGEDLGQQGWRSREEQDKLVAAVNASGSPEVLDIACGSGGPSLAIVAHSKCRLTGVDIEPAAIDEAKARVVEAGFSERASFRVANCDSRLPFDDQSFNVILCIDAVLHLGERSAVLRDWFRLLVPGGCLIFSDAAVLTGPLSKQEIEVRASQGEFVLVPHGYNESVLEQSGFILRERQDRTAAVADIAKRLHSARVARSEQLQHEEGGEWFDRRQSSLRMTEELAATNRLARFLYVAERPVL